MTERGHDRDTLQCRVKVKELQNTYHKAREANRRSRAAPTSCYFYKELDAILGGNPTSTMKATMVTLVACVPVETGSSQEEEILDKDVKRDPEAEDDSEVRDACSQEHFSTLEKASQSQQSELGDVQTREEAPKICLRDLQETLMETLGNLLLQVLWQSCFVSCPIKDMTWEPSLPLCYRQLNGCAELESSQEELKRTFWVMSWCTPWLKNKN
ncbi:uncharacterized protein ACDP82_015216 [Pangshura tecta]